MRQLIFLVLLLMIVLFYGCKAKENMEFESPSIEKQMLGGFHPLKKMISNTENQSSANAGFFLFAGSLHQESSQIETVQFSWETNDGSYAISKVRIEDVRIRICKSVTTPYIEFHYEEPCHLFSQKLQELIEESVQYIEIFCNESDWPTDIQLPMN